MLPALGAITSLFDAINSSKSSSKATTGFTGGKQSDFGADRVISSADTVDAQTSSVSGTLGIAPETLKTLLAAQGQASTGSTPSDPLQDLFAQLDGNGDGKISKTEFESALGAGGSNVANADDVFGKLDKDGDGSVSLSELTSALKGAGKGRHHPHVGNGGVVGPGGSADGSANDFLMQALQGASSTSTTNSDGTVTTSLTYADGSKVSTTSAPTGASGTGSASRTATSSYNFI